jgi:basic amino acid/polyamine antiporter, APA family
MATTSSPELVEEAEGGSAGKLGLAATTSLVVGGIVGTGIFGVPASVATYGWLSIPAFVVVALGSLALALSFSSLAARTTRSGGPYRFADDAFGEFAGFLAAWTYWIQGWTGHATIATAGAGYAATLLGLADGRTTTLLLALAIFALPLLNNVVSTRSVGTVAVVTTVVKITALAVVAVVGLVLIDPGDVGPVREHDGQWAAALPSACAVLLFAFLGMEGAAVATDRVRDPRRTVPRAIVGGVLGVSVLYLAGTLAVQGTAPQDVLAESSAPFSDAAAELFGGSWAGKAIAAVAVVSALGSLNGWNMVNAEMVAGAARDGLFPRPLARRVRGLPLPALFVNGALAIVLLVLNAAGNALDAFETLALLSTFVYVFGYVLSVGAQLLWAVRSGRDDVRPTRVQLGVAGVAMAFSLWMAGATGASAVQAGTVLLLCGIPVYVVVRGLRERGAA